MKKETETVYKNKDNVVYTISNDFHSCYDIDVPDNVETVMLGISEDEILRTGEAILAFNLVKSEKSFPNVKKLIIGNCVFHINIPNSLFPNVREVISYSRHFDSGKYIVHLTDSYSPMKLLYNSFCLGPDEALDLDGIHIIEGNALEGCQTTKVINANKTKILDRQALHGSAFEQLKAGRNQCLMLGNFVIGVDENAEVLEIPKDISGIMRGINIDNVHRLIIHNLNIPTQFKGSPDILVLAEDAYLSTPDIFYPKLCTVKFEVDKENVDLKAIDGVLYSSGGSVLYRVPDEMTGHFDVPDGVELIYSHAFAKSKISSVAFPDSLKEIGRQAFESCKYLENVDFGNGIEIIGTHKDSRYADTSMFLGCYKLKSISFPKQIKEIGPMAFYKSGLKTVKLNEGLRRIHRLAFACCEIEELKIPSSVYSVDQASFADVKHIIFEDKDMAASAPFSLMNENSNIGSVCVTAGNESVYFMRPSLVKCLAGEVDTIYDMKKLAEEQSVFMSKFLIKKGDSNGFKKMLKINDYCYDTLKSILDNIQIDNAVCMAYLMDEIGKKREKESEFSV